MPVRNVVMGLGQSGLSCARYLSRRGETVTIVDNRQRPPCIDAAARELPQATLSLGQFDESLLQATDRLIVSPGIGLDEPFVVAAMRREIPVCGDIELFAQEVAQPVIAVTGSNGKSTVVSMVRDMLSATDCSAVAGGNLGPPALDLLPEPGVDVFVLELSSFQLERTSSLRPAAAVVLNVSPDHFDRYDSLTDYARAKSRVYQRAVVAVVNRGDLLVGAMQPDCERIIAFGLDAPGAGDYGLVTTGSEGWWLARGKQPLIRADDLRVRGRHNLENALAALALVEALDQPMHRLLQGLAAYPGLPHRTQWIAESDGVTFINDSKATNVGAAVAAVEGLDGPLVVIAGGDSKNADFAPFAKALTGKARAAVLLGRDASDLQTALAGACETRRVGNMHDAVIVAAELAHAGDTVLLSPACSSQDMFEDFAARGDAFTRAVRELPA